jgi:hypothetical protein
MKIVMKILFILAAVLIFGSILGFSDSFAEDSEKILPPKKQLKLTDSYEMIICKDGFDLIFKVFSFSPPVCLKPLTAEKLIERGWGRAEPYSHCIEIEKTQKYTKVPFKVPKSHPEGFEFECARKDSQGTGDIFYLKNELENIGANSDEVLGLGGIQIHFAQIFDPTDSTIPNATERIHYTHEKMGESSRLVDINGILGVMKIGCDNCGTINYNMENGETFRSSYTPPNRVQFYDENGIFYNIRSYQSTEILLDLARSLE